MIEVTKMDYNQAYRDIEHLFGVEPEPLLKRCYMELDMTKPVLDIGAGQGRNCLFLAREGFDVVAIEPSAVGIEAISTSAAKEGLSVQAHQTTFEAFRPGSCQFGGFLVFGLIQELPRESIELLISRINSWTMAGSFVFVTCFTTDDSAYPRISKEWKNIGKRSFADEDGTIRTYLEPKEILGMFGGYKVIHHWEGFGPMHRHGDGPPEQHAKAELVIQR